MKLKFAVAAIALMGVIASCAVTPVPVVPSIDVTIVPTTCTSGVPLAVLGGKYISGKENYSAFHTSSVGDGLGNTYSAGMYTGNVDFGGTQLVGRGAYLSKSDRIGKFIWVVKLPDVTYLDQRFFDRIFPYDRLHPKVYLSGGKVVVKGLKSVVGKYPVKIVSTYNTDGMAVNSVEIPGNIYVYGEEIRYAMGDVFFDATGNKYYALHKSTGSYLQKINAAGTVVWTKNMSSVEEYTEAFVVNLLVSSDGSIYMMTRQYARIENTTQDNFQKRDANGTIIYDTATPEVYSSNSQPFYTIDASGNAYSNAKSYRSLMKFNTNGNIAWEKTYPYEQEVTGLSVDISGNIYAIGNLRGNTLTVGSTTLVRNTPILYYIMKLNSSGDGLWPYFVKLPTATPANALIVHNNLSEIFVAGDNLYLTGSIDKQAGSNTFKGYDFFSIRYKICP
ncbi:MAG: hypothetical protein EOP47_24425 [Sphingobacteriaceae bacterium]|nr:MAG: hypothetical protein EOP47_24425 [Sphingobacteriaceae bacterium]